MNKPIGVFDSGIGGFTVARAINELLPRESLCYFGDTVHLPYGDKSEKSIQEYSLKVFDFLLQQKVKLIVIACNSASAVAFEVLKKKYKNMIPIINMVDPIIDDVVKKEYKKIGVIGTKATIKTEIHKRKILKIRPNMKVEGVATPLLAPMIEEGFYNNNISKTIIDSYLSHYKLKNIYALILACTHYPLIKKDINNFYQKKIDIIDPALLVAYAVRDVLKKNKCFVQTDQLAKNKFYVSSWTNAFAKSVKIFWGDEVPLIEKNIWK